jgi:predicted metal-dependent enzyme (double-stranded beta helix superfamily)
MVTIHAKSHEDQYILDNPTIRRFIEAVNDIRHSGLDARATVAKIRPHFAELMADQAWLPEMYQEPAEGSGMGGGTGMWLLYRAGDEGLAFSSLVLRPGMSTPVHDHLAWGLVGLYRGLQDEVVYRRRDDGSHEGEAQLEVSERNSLKPGDFYELMPENDIHNVTTTSDVTSVSLHLLGNDNGCIWRHRFYPAEHRVEPFRSGYVNIDCDRTE